MSRGRSYEWQLVGTRQERCRDLVDAESGARMMRVTGQHIRGHAGTTVELSDRTVVTLPVRAVSVKIAVMSSVDQAGNVLIRYRMKSIPWLSPLRQVEVAVSPDAASLPGIELLSAVTACCLPRYSSGGGGG
jgi:hypothetical protein